MRDHRQREDNGGEYCNRLDVRDFSVHGDGAAERDTFDVVLSCTGCVPARAAYHFASVPARRLCVGRGAGCWLGCTVSLCVFDIREFFLYESSRVSLLHPGSSPGSSPPASSTPASRSRCASACSRSKPTASARRRLRVYRLAELRRRSATSSWRVQSTLMVAWGERRWYEPAQCTSSSLRVRESGASTASCQRRRRAVECMWPKRLRAR